ncbi:MAG TPA: sodium/proline symporter [Rhabdochlamydiaceae bacterium]|nr:sodium/proline symporter [Rhabdochlamydiaceae bacterium]
MASTYIYELIAIICYFALLFLIGYLSYRKHLSEADFIIGSRSLNYWLTALAAHASDMSSWLFLGYPAVVFGSGMIGAWSAVGLLVFMFLNWQLVAPKIRIATEQFNSYTFSSYFESRFADTSGLIRIFTALMQLAFYTIYISAGLVGLGLLIENLFQIPYDIGIMIGILIVVPYVFIGGYTTLAWIDLFQGIFLMLVVIFVPFYIMSMIGGYSAVQQAISAKHLSISLIPHFDSRTLLDIFFMVAGWGLGYFGQPHIVTKFMGIKNVHEISKSKWIGMTWMVLSLGAATLVGLVGIAFFKTGIKDPEQIFIQMVRTTFVPFISGFFLCAILAATINAMSSQVLVLSSSLTEDFYKRLLRKTASSKELLLVSRLGVILVAILAFFVAFGRFSTIYSLVLYAWSGLGAAFGPLLILSLYSNRINKYGAWAGILSGGIVAAIWPYFDKSFNIIIPSLLPGFFISLIAIVAVSHFTRHKVEANP